MSVKPCVVLKVKVALVIAVQCVAVLLYPRPQNTAEPRPVSSTVRRSVAVSKAAEPRPVSSTQSRAVLHVFSLLQLAVSLSATLVPLSGGLVVFLFLASTYNGIGHILRRWCFLKLVIEGKKEGTRRYLNLKDRALDNYNNNNNNNNNNIYLTAIGLSPGGSGFNL